MITAATVEQPTSESTGTIDRGTTITVTQAGQTTTSDSDIMNITLAVTTTINISTDDDGATSAVTETRDTTITRDDSNSSTTVGQSSAENRGGPNPTVIAGGIVAVALISISGIAIITVIVVVIKKRGKTVGAYSLPNNPDRTLKSIPNGAGKLAMWFI